MAKKTMDEKLFRAIKIMTSGGATINEISEYFKVAPATVSRVRASENIVEYRAILAAMHAKNKTKQPEPEPVSDPEPVKAVQPVNPTVVRVEATHYMMEELRKLNETMTLISNKLALIVDQLT